MSKTPSVDEVLDKAFVLACFIQGDRRTAISIVFKAMIKLEVAAASQGKRLYYKPIGRYWPRRSRSEGFRNKVSFNEIHLLQRLIYIESEPYEIQKERNGSIALSDEELVIHFIKHLVRITLKRNSFYITLGLTRLLYHYSTAEAMEIYNAVIQDPDRVKDDYYYRSRKGVLMQEMKERFGDLLHVCRGAHGEERFQTLENPGRFVEIVEECLKAFTPWWTPCLVPGTDRVMDGIPQFSYQGHQLEDQIEVNRIHAVLHPYCLCRLIKALGLKAPEQNLAVPLFFSSNGRGDNGMGGAIRHPAGLDEDELRCLKNDLEKERKRRNSSSAGLLSVVVDGVERGHLDLNRVSRFDFDIERDAELLEIRALDGSGDKVLLATLLIDPAEEDEVKTRNASIILEGGQEVSIAISTRHKVANSSVTVEYRETAPLRAALLYLRRRMLALKEGAFNQRSWNRSPLLKTALACILLAFATGSAIYYLKKETPSRVSVANANTQPAGSPGQEQTKFSPPAAHNGLPGKPDRSKIDAKDKTGTATVIQSENKNGNPEPDNNAVLRSESNVSEAESTRGLGTGPAAVSLGRVKKIYVSFVGDPAATESLRSSLIANFRTSNRFSFSDSRDEADTLMRVFIHNAVGSQPASVSVQLINGRGDIIWPTAHTRSRGNYLGSVAVVSKSIVEDLLDEIRLAEKGR